MTTCKHCEQPFDPATTWQEFCSAKCRNSWHYINHLAAEREAERKRCGSGSGYASDSHTGHRRLMPLSRRCTTVRTSQARGDGYSAR